MLRPLLLVDVNLDDPSIEGDGFLLVASFWRPWICLIDFGQATRGRGGDEDCAGSLYLRNAAAPNFEDRRHAPSERLQLQVIVLVVPFVEDDPFCPLAPENQIDPWVRTIRLDD